MAMAVIDMKPHHRRMHAAGSRQWDGGGGLCRGRQGISRGAGWPGLPAPHEFEFDSNATAAGLVRR